MSTTATASSTGRRDHTATPESDRRFERIALAIFAVYVTVLSALHEPWKDETQTWRMAIDSDGIAALVHNSRYEGHPLLFHLMLQALGHLSRSWWAPVVLHIVIACATVWVVLRYAPFNRMEKLLVIAGYFLAYEYAVIVRPYGLGMLLAFGACAAWSAQQRRPMLAALLLILLANTSVLGLVVALAAAGAFLIDWIWPDNRPFRFTTRHLAIGAACVAVTAGVVWLVAVQVVPPPDAGYTGERSTAKGPSVWEIGSRLMIPLKAMVPISRIGDGTVQWNKSLFVPMGRGALALFVVLSMMVVAVGCVIAARRRTSLLFFLAGTLGLVIFFELFLQGYARHHGALVIVWIMAAWLSRASGATTWPAFVQPITERAVRWAPRLFAISLVPMVIATAEFAAGDALLTFSDARAVADLIRARSLSDGPLVGVAPADAQTVGALLDRPVLFAAERRSATFVIWGNSQSPDPTLEEVTAAIDTSLQRGCPVTLIATTDIPVPSVLLPTMQLIYETPVRPMSRNRFRVYVRPAPASARCTAAPTL